MKKHGKIILKEFVRSFGRFIAVLAIIALGVGFLIGIMQSTPNMKRTMDTFYDQADTYDVQIKSTFGLYPDDIEAIRNVSGVTRISPSNVLDIGIESTRYKGAVGRVTGVDFANQQMNRLTLIEGEFPSVSGECVVERGNTYLQEFEVGDVIRIASASDRERFHVSNFRVTGVVTDTLYYAKSEKERSAAGNGRLGAALYVLPSDFDMTVTQEVYDMLGGAQELNFRVGDPVFTDCFVTVQGARALEVFSDEYEKLIAEGADRLSGIGTTRISDLKDRIQSFNEDAELQANAALEQIGNGLSQLEGYRVLLEDALAAGTITPDQADSYFARLNPEIDKLLAQKEEVLSRLDALFTDLDGIEWYVLDRTMNTSYASMAINIDKVRAIAGIFPIFFILVAALVALTTMTKMVEDDRTQIGMLKALGYSKMRILTKYLLYGGLATLLGCGLGVACGFAVLPTLLWQAYATLYFLPTLTIEFGWVFSSVATVVALAATSLVTVFTCLHSLRARPAELMLPKAPKAGKRILLERIGWLWRPLPFKFKSMLRNIFRYKKNMWMTIIGVAGCTALIVTGFGIQDSVRTIAKRQFEVINRYDMTISITGSKRNETLSEFIAQYPNVSVREESGYLSTSEGKENLTFYAAGEELADYVRMQPRNGKEELPFGEDAVILTENLAKEYKIRLGDTVLMGLSGGEERAFTVTGITENYVNCYAYIHKGLFEREFGSGSEDLILLRTGITPGDEDRVTETLLACEAVTGVEFTSQTRVSYDNLLQTMKLITLVLIACAGCLSVIVLYNLTNINIDERKKELATLKVLGYRPIEVAGYVYREAIMLTLVGMLVGLALGALLHLFVIAQVETVTMMLGRGVHALSFLYSAAITLIFAGVVDAMLAPKLAKIKMADSMKAND